MLNLYRRHQPPCRYASRRYRNCNCPIWVQGSLRDEYVRRALDLRSWSAATDAGHNLFIVGSDEPALFEVQPRNDRFDFDLVAFAPADAWRQLSTFEYDLPELTVASADAVGKASERVVQSFAKHFQEFRLKRGGARAERQSLYTVDDCAGREAIRQCRARQGVGEAGEPRIAGGRPARVEEWL